MAIESKDGRSTVRMTKTTLNVRIYTHRPGEHIDFSLADLLRDANLSSTEAYNLMESVVTRQGPRERFVRGAFVTLFKGRRRVQFIAENGERCRYCRRKGDARNGPDGKAWHIDHVTPVAAGGTNARENLALACAGCNTAKGHRG